MPDVDGRVLIPADQFVLKVHSRCDLACDHCYVYESADQTWRGRPLVISPDVVSHAAMRVAEHVKTHDLSRVEIVLHGGEPLLAGVSGLRAIITQLAGALSGLCRLDVKVHTNGVLLSEEICELFAEHNVGVGVSLDGDRVANDRHRNYRDGRSSYDAAVRAIRLLTTDRYRHLYSGLLCTIDVANDPVKVYESLMEFGPPRVDFLLPHATWDAPPARPAGSGTEYADWLIEIFDRWQADGYPVRIRTFDSIIATLAGDESGTEALGLAPVRMVVIETDGTYEQADSLKVAYDGAAATGLDVFTRSLDSVLEHPGVAARQHGIADLSAACQQCPVVTSCGGGMYAHRYMSGSGFDNPSVYCADLLKLIEHIKGKLPHAVGAARGEGHRISEQALAELAAGLGGADAIGELTQVQRSLRRGLLTAVYAQAMGAPAVSRQVKDQVRAAWQALVIAEGSGPDAVDTVLGHPYLRVWAMRCLEQLGEASHDGAAALATDLSHLGGIAATAAIRGQAKARVTVPVIAGAIHLPGLGRLVIEPPPGLESAVLEVDADWVRVRIGTDGWRVPRPRLLIGESCLGEPCAPDGAPGAATSSTASWQGVRVLNAVGIQVALEDTDPYRDCYQWSAAPRLTEQEFARWQHDFTLAWQEIQRHQAPYAQGLATGLLVLTPMSRTAAGSDVSSAARHAFGAIGVALPSDSSTLALLLMREFQHVKLGALLDACDLFDAADKRPYHAPWRTDPGPLERLLGDAYAHLAVCEFWRTRAMIGEQDRARAAERYALWHWYTADSVETLASSGSLTALGGRFIDRMRAGLAAKGEEPHATRASLKTLSAQE